MLDNIYRLDAPLGKGGVGVVFKAWHLHLQRPCAIKFLHPQLVSNPELRTRFRREAQSAFQLGHPHIVAITDFRDDPSSWPYLVMELVQGQSLRDRLEKGPLDPQLAVRLMSELADALVAAHRRGVIHRDLKPENLLLGTVENPAPGEPDLCLKVLDFGLSKMLDGVEITGTGRLVGSPSYMAPEQARGDSNIVDARSDIWSVGVLLFECLTADKLFATDDFEQKRQQIMSAKLPPLHFTEKGLPPLIEKIITRCCQRLPEHRYQSATALLSADREFVIDYRWRITGGVVVVPSPLSSTPIAETMTIESNRAKSSGPEVVVIPAFVKSMLPDNSTASIIKNGEMVADRAAREKPKRSGVGIALALATVALAFTGFAGYTLWQSRQSLPIGTANAGLLPDKLSTSSESTTLTAGTTSNNVGTGNAAIVEAPTGKSTSGPDGAVTADLQPSSSVGGPVTVADAATPSLLIERTEILRAVRKKRSTRSNRATTTGQQAERTTTAAQSIDATAARTTSQSRWLSTDSPAALRSPEVFARSRWLLRGRPVRAATASRVGPVCDPSEQGAHRAHRFVRRSSPNPRGRRCRFQRLSQGHGCGWALFPVRGVAAYQNQRRSHHLCQWQG